MIEDRKRSGLLEERQDLLSNLVRASEEKCDPQQKDFDFEFTHRDLLGNIFLFLLAGKSFRFQCSKLDFPLSSARGYKTTASALSFAVALLATHQDEQEELYKHVRSVVPEGRLPVRRVSCRDICSLYPIRPIKMFHNSLEFSQSSTRHYAFSLQSVPFYA